MACPVCQRPPDPAFRPFCSRRCADVDLAHWLRGDYRLPTDEAGDEAVEIPLDTPGRLT